MEDSSSSYMDIHETIDFDSEDFIDLNEKSGEPEDKFIPEQNQDEHIARLSEENKITDEKQIIEAKNDNKMNINSQIENKNPIRLGKSDIIMLNEKMAELTLKSDEPAYIATENDSQIKEEYPKINISDETIQTEPELSVEIENIPTEIAKESEMANKLEESSQLWDEKVIEESTATDFSISTAIQDEYTVDTQFTRANQINEALTLIETELEHITDDIAQSDEIKAKQARKYESYSSEAYIEPQEPEKTASSSDSHVNYDYLDQEEKRNTPVVAEGEMENLIIDDEIPEELQENAEINEKAEEIDQDTDFYTSLIGKPPHPKNNHSLTNTDNLQSPKKMENYPNHCPKTKKKEIQYFDEYALEEITDLNQLENVETQNGIEELEEFDLEEFDSQKVENNQNEIQKEIVAKTESNIKFELDNLEDLPEELDFDEIEPENHILEEMSLVEHQVENKLPSVSEPAEIENQSKIVEKQEQVDLGFETEEEIAQIPDDKSDFPGSSCPDILDQDFEDIPNDMLFYEDSDITDPQFAALRNQQSKKEQFLESKIAGGKSFSTLDLTGKESNDKLTEENEIDGLNNEKKTVGDMEVLTKTENVTDRVVENNNLETSSAISKSEVELESKNTELNCVNEEIQSKLNEANDDAEIELEEYDFGEEFENKSDTDEIEFLESLRKGRETVEDTLQIKNEMPQTDFEPVPVEEETKESPQSIEQKSSASPQIEELPAAFFSDEESDDEFTKSLQQMSLKNKQEEQANPPEQTANSSPIGLKYTQNETQKPVPSPEIVSTSSPVAPKNPPVLQKTTPGTVRSSNSIDSVHSPSDTKPSQPSLFPQTKNVALNKTSPVAKFVPKLSYKPSLSAIPVSLPNGNVLVITQSQKSRFVNNQRVDSSSYSGKEYKPLKQPQTSLTWSEIKTKAQENKPNNFYKVLVHKENFTKYVESPNPVLTLNEAFNSAVFKAITDPLTACIEILKINSPQSFPMAFLLSRGNEEAEKYVTDTFLNQTVDPSFHFIFQKTAKSFTPYGTVNGHEKWADFLQFLLIEQKTKNLRADTKNTTAIEHLLNMKKTHSEQFYCLLIVHFVFKLDYFTKYKEIYTFTDEFARVLEYLGIKGIERKVEEKKKESGGWQRYVEQGLSKIIGLETPPEESEPNKLKFEDKKAANNSENVMKTENSTQNQPNSLQSDQLNSLDNLAGKNTPSNQQIHSVDKLQEKKDIFSSHIKNSPAPEPKDYAASFADFFSAPSAVDPVEDKPVASPQRSLDDTATDDDIIKPVQPQTTWTSSFFSFFKSNKEQKTKIEVDANVEYKFDPVAKKWVSNRKVKLIRDSKGKRPEERIAEKNENNLREENGKIRPPPIPVPKRRDPLPKNTTQKPEGAKNDVQKPASLASRYVLNQTVPEEEINVNDIFGVGRKPKRGN